MTQNIPQGEPQTSGENAIDYDAIVIGAGVSGLYQVHSLRKLGMTVRAFETGGGVGGTWYWNRYPGCRFDSESYSYGYSFSKELLEDWNWSELFSGQPETERYLNHVADRFDLRRDIQLNTRVVSASWHDDGRYWEVELDDGARVRSTILITAVGILSASFTPDIPGLEKFAGKIFYTAKWPHEQPDFTGLKVGVVGAGSTAVQIIPELAPVVEHLTVFQRTPNYCTPLHNRPIGAAEMADIKRKYDEIFALTKRTAAAFIHDFDPRNTFDVSDEERERKYEELWQTPGFGTWLSNFQDVVSDEKANACFAEFVRNKIRARVKDPIVAEMLIPKNYVFGAKRVPMETNYYEVYNRDNVTLVDVKATPISGADATSLKVGAASYDLDAIVFATGFDAITGALGKIDIRGRGGETLKDKWSEGPQTYLGLSVHDFPNFFMILGPHNGATFCNMPRCIEQNVEWISECIAHMRREGAGVIEATAAAEADWTQHCHDSAIGSFFNPQNVSSWWNGGNIPGKKVVNLMYLGGRVAYVERVDAVAAEGYSGFEID